MNNVNPSIFRAYDIRGVVDQSLSEKTVYLIGRALAAEIIQGGENKVAIGRDGRLSGPRFAQQLIAGFLESGVDVYDLGCVPTPVVYFAANKYANGSCVVITGSHNPPEYNGLKMMVCGHTLSSERIQKLRQNIEQGKFNDGRGEHKIQPVFEEYVSAVCARVQLSRPLKVVIDAGNGVAGGFAPELMHRLGCEVTALYCEVDGNFPNHHPDPSKPENLSDLIDAVRNKKADIGLAFDGDGDRLGVVDAQGNIIYPDRQLIMYAQDILTKHPAATIIYDVKCSVHVPREIEKSGGVAIMSRTGHSFIKAALKEQNAALAGEMSGHIFFNDDWYGFDDALYTAARLLQIVSRSELNTVQLFSTIPDSKNTPELNIHFAEGEHYKAMDKIIALANFKDGMVSTLDGLRVDFEKSWGLVRPSNTTPVLVLRFEGEDELELQSVINRFAVLIQDACPEAVLPEEMMLV